MLKKSIKFREFKIKDTNFILKIYNYYIKNGLSNFEENVVTLNNFTIYIKKILKLKVPFLVCEHNKIIIGFTFLNTFRNKSGYKFTFENSIYIDNNFVGKGIGSLLLKKLINESCKNKKIKSIISVISQKESKKSIEIHQKNGFKKIGILKKVGFKKNTWIDVIYMQRILNEKN